MQNKTPAPTGCAEAGSPCVGNPLPLFIRDRQVRTEQRHSDKVLHIAEIFINFVSKNH